MSAGTAVKFVALIALGALGGCKMPSASLQLLDGLDTALGNVSSGQQVVRQSVSSQLVGQQEALDTAFEADLRNLAGQSQSPSAAGSASQPNGLGADEAAGATVKLADVLTAKRLYDIRRTELAAGRANVVEAFDRLDNNLTASRQMVNMLRQLVMQQDLMSGQTGLMINALLKRPAGGGASPQVLGASPQVGAAGPSGNP